MSRQNTAHDEKSLRAMGELFITVGKEVVDLANRMRREKVKEKIRLAHQATMESGLLAAKKFVREGSAKLDAIADEADLRG